MKYLTLLFLFLVVNPSQSLGTSLQSLLPILSSNQIGVAQGHPEPELRGVLKLFILSGDGKPQYIKSTCSGALVGLKPLTVFTARHCVENNGGSVNPVAFISPDQKFYRADRVLFPESTDLIQSDLALLTFLEATQIEGTEKDHFQYRAEDLFSLAPVDYRVGDEVEFCGYGLESDSSSPDTSFEFKKLDLRCGKSQLIFTPTALAGWSDFGSDQEGVETIKKLLDSFSMGHRFLATGRYKDGEYQPTQPMTNRGDSGGPLFIRKNGTLHLIGITSALIASKNTFVISALSASISTPEGKLLIEKFLKEGVKLNGLTSIGSSDLPHN